MRRASILLLVALQAIIAACSSPAQPGTSSPAGGASGGSAATTAAVPSAAGTARPSAAGTAAFEGTLVTSGQYSATWTVAPDMPANPFNSVDNPSLTSDKGTFGNIAVQPDGSVAFGSAASELTNGAYEGTGAKVTLDTSGQFVCAFTLDSDLKGTRDGAILHMSGGMTVHWTLGVGEQNCP